MRSSETVGGRQRAVGREGRARRAFTLVEIMIVVVIIGLMAGIITYATTGMLDKAKHKRAISDIVTLDGAVDLYHGDRDKFPTNQEGLAVLVPQYIKVLQNDPWGRPYQYVQPGRNRAYDIISFGADGREGGSGADADITNSDVEVKSAKK
ncbi:MAG: ral secretion pathway protein [Phycisphaerales bacterium]|nr:ral secretion pathway protein [Phycisphaerales bacterium]